MNSLTAVRHAPPVTAGICYGRLDIQVAESPVKARGIVQARLAQMKPVDWAEEGSEWTVHSSPSPRCRTLAEELAASVGAQLTIDRRLLELNFGVWEGVRWSDLAGDPAFEAWAADWTRLAPPQGESLPELETRVRSWWQQTTSTEASQRRLLVGHAGVIRALRVHLEGRPWNEVMAEPVPYLEPLKIAS